MGLLTREAILGAVDLLTEDVEVPEWGGVVRVRGLTGAERDRFEATVVQVKGRKTAMNLNNLRARLVALTAIDENGEPLFSSKDVSALGDKSAAALERVFNAAQRLSGLSDEDVEELTKN